MTKFKTRKHFSRFTGSHVFVHDIMQTYSAKPIPPINFSLSFYNLKIFDGKIEKRNEENKIEENNDLSAIKSINLQTTFSGF